MSGHRTDTVLLPADNTEIALKNQFEEFQQQANEWLEKAKAIVVTEENKDEVIPEARKARLALRNIRINVEKKRVEMKEESLRRGKLIDEVAGQIKKSIEPIEDTLKDAEEYEERREAERIQKLRRERFEKLAPYRIPGDNMESINFGEMHETVFDNFLLSQKVAHEQRKERENQIAEEKARQAREAAEERERIAHQNRILSARNARINRLMPMGFVYNAELQYYVKDTFAITMDDIDSMVEMAFNDWVSNTAKELIRRQKISDAAEAKRQAELKELREKDQKAQREKAEQAEKEKKLKRAPDKTKLLAAGERISLIEAPDLKTEEAKKIWNQVTILLLKVHRFINDEAEKL